VRLEFCDISAGAERSARSRDHNRAHRPVELHCVQRRAQRAHKFVVEGVELVWPVQRQDRDRPVMFDKERIEHIGYSSW
jgi:hypothetical protein